MGYGSEAVIFGVDVTGIIKMLADKKVKVHSTHGSLPYFIYKRFASACYLYGAVLMQESPGSVDPEKEVERIFNEICTGTDEYFDYGRNVLGAKDVFDKYADWMTGEDPLVDIAVFFPTTWYQLCASDRAYPPRTMEACGRMRDIMDYDVVDERTVGDGALDRYKVLLVVEGDCMEPQTAEILRDWVSSGGILLTYDFGKITSVEGEAIAQDLFGFTGDRSLGKGRVISLKESWEQKEALFRSLAETFHGPVRLRMDPQGQRLIDDAWDGVFCTVLPTRIALFNSNKDKEVVKEIRFAGKTHTITLAPWSIGLIPL
jgi:hypothetical protein